MLSRIMFLTCITETIQVTEGRNNFLDDHMWPAGGMLVIPGLKLHSTRVDRPQVVKML